MITDFSKQQGPVGDMFALPVTKDQWHEFKLSNEQLDFYKEQGYVAGVKVLDENQIEKLRLELQELIKPSHPGNSLFYEFSSNESVDPSKVLFHALGAWRISEGFHDILWNPRFLVPASQLLGGAAVRLWHDQLFCKPANHGGVVAWHQDYSYWTRTVPMNHLTSWCGLDDADTENGCLYYVPGSQHWGLLDKPELAGKMEGIFENLNDAQKAEFKPVAIELKAGHATFHHPLMLHGSYENKTNRERRAFVINVFADGTRSDSDGELLAGTSRIAKGSLMDGQFHPLLFDPATSL